MRPLAAGIAMVTATLVGASGACSRDNPTPPRSASSQANHPTGASNRSGPSSAVASTPSARSSATAMGDGGPPSWRTDPVFSAPIGALRSAGSTVVAGLVASAGALRAVGFRPDGSSWTRDVLTGLAPDPDAEVKLDRAGDDGVAIVWKGKAAAGPAKLVVLGLAGDVRAEAGDIGAEWCTTADGVAWVEGRPRGVARAEWRAWSGGASRDIASIPAGRTPSVVCGDHDVFTLGDGDDDLTATVFAPNETTARPASVILRGGDFEDDEVEHRVYTAADDLQIVRVAESGALSIREVPPSGLPRAWRSIKHRMAEDEDIVAVDGDSTRTVVVSTRAHEDECPNAELAAEQVSALRIDRPTGAETVAEVAPADCARSVGPFWVARLGGPSPLVAWVEQRTDVVPGAPAIHGLAYAVLRSKRPETGRLDIDSDALVDAGCDTSGCFAAALIGATVQDAGSRAPSNGAGPPPIGRASAVAPSSIVVFEYP